jgi:hypothetical protein
MKKFEDFAQKTLNQYDSPLDTDRLWSGIDQQLRPRKKRFLWLIWPIATSSVLAIAYVVWTQKIPDQPSKSAEVIDTSSATIHSQPGPIRQKEQSTQSGQLQHTAVILPVAQTQPDMAVKNAGKQSPTRPSAVQQALIYSGNQELPGDIQETKQPESIVTMEGIDPVGVIGEGIPASTIPDQLKYNEDLLPHPDVVIMSPLKSLQKIQQTTCFNWNERKTHLFFGIEGGLQFPIKSLKLVDPNYEKTYNLRTSSETVLEAWHASVFAGFEHRSGLGLQAGLEFQCINERFDWSTHTKDTIGSQLITTTLIYAPGDTAIYQEYQPITRETDITQRNYNNYRFIQIPVTVSYAFKSRHNLTPYIKASALISLVSGQKATIFNTNWQPELYESKSKTDNYPFRTNGGISLRAALGIRYGFGKKYSLFAEGNYQYQFNKITTSAYPLSQKYQLPGFSVGALYFIN